MPGLPRSRQLPIDYTQPLRNVRHERFVMLIVAGVPQMEAFTQVGYEPHRGNASRLQMLVAPRIDAVLKRQEAERAHVMAAAAAEPWLSRDFVLEGLRSNAERALQAIPVMDARGQPTGEYRWDGSVANRALELLGKELWMFAEKRIIDQRITVSDEQQTEIDRILDESATKLRLLREGKLIEHEE
jgi:hypothetical protein